MARRPTLDDHTTAESAPAAPAVARGEKPLAIVVYTRDGAKAYAIGANAQLVIGRAWPADIVVAELDLSRHHARFDRIGDDVFVRDLGSTNGTRVGGVAITDRTPLAAGEVVSMGPVHAIVQVLESPDVALVEVAGHDRFLADLEAEVARMRSFGRRLALVVYSSAARAREPGPHAALLVRAVRDRLRPFDHLGMYAPGVVEVLLPETDVTAARSTALATLAAAGGGVLAGIAGFPESGATANELLDAARSALRRATASSPVASALGEQGDRDDAEVSGPVIVSPRMRELYATVERIARSALPVLVRGETGTGKEEIARALHRLGPRKDKALRAVNCAALPATLLESTLFGHEKGAFTGADRKTAGVFEQANGGTLFLDEIGELTAASQAALLRALETKHVTRVGGAEEIPVDVRVVAATHRELEQMCETGTFRWDLFYRLDSLSVQVPPLRERREEIEPLASYFLERARARGETEATTIELDALACLREYSWPGNVRELRNVIERAAVISASARIGVADLGERVRGASKRESEVVDDTTAGDAFKDRVRAYETQLILDALERCDWNQTAAARALDMPLRTLVHKIGTYGIRKKYER